MHTDGSVTKDQSGLGFAVRQGATTIHEDSAVYTVSTSSLTMEVEAVTHALHWSASRGDSQTTHAIILTDSRALLQSVKNAIGSPDRHVSNAVILTDSVGLLQRVKSGTGSPDRHVSVSVPDIHLRRLLWVY